MTWNLFILTIVILITIAKLLDIIFIYQKDKIHEKLISYWIFLTDTKINNFMVFCIKKTDLIFDKIIGNDWRLYRNLLLLSGAFIGLFFYITYASMGGLTWKFFSSHIIWSSFTFVTSILLTKLIIKKSIKLKSNFKVLLFIILDLVLLLSLLSFNPWNSIFSSKSQEYYRIIEHFTHLPSDKLDKNISKAVAQNGGNKLKSLGSGAAEYLIKRRFIENTIGIKVTNLVDFLKQLSSIFVILPTFINLLVIIFLFFMNLIARPSIFLIERVLYVVADDPKKSIFLIIASFLSVILALVNAIIKF